MITYELCLLLRVMPKPELVTTLKRTAGTIFSNGGVIKKLENLGTRETPHKISAHGLPHRQASYYFIEFIAPPTSIDTLLDEYGRDVDIIKRSIFKKRKPENFECTLHEELQPPPYRQDVQELIAKSKAPNTKKWKYNTGLDYYPFQK